MTVLTSDEAQRWRHEVERDPGAAAFVRLADAHRRAGQGDEALRICRQGVEYAPRNVPGRRLLARLLLERGDRAGACAQWEATLAMDPENFEAHRGLGFHHLESEMLQQARWHLERAAAVRPADAMVREALALVAQREMDVEERRLRDPARLFEALTAEAPFLGALLMDERGLVLAGAFREGGDTRAEALGASLGGVVEEGRRAAELLGLGDWKGVVVHAESAVLHAGRLPPDHLVAVATNRDTPTGWVLRTAQRAAELARSFLGSEHG